MEKIARIASFSFKQCSLLDSDMKSLLRLILFLVSGFFIGFAAFFLLDSYSIHLLWLLLSISISVSMLGGLLILTWRIYLLYKHK